MEMSEVTKIILGAMGSAVTVWGIWWQLRNTRIIERMKIKERLHTDNIARLLKAKTQLDNMVKPQSAIRVEGGGEDLSANQIYAVEVCEWGNSSTRIYKTIIDLLSKDLQDNLTAFLSAFEIAHGKTIGLSHYYGSSAQKKIDLLEESRNSVIALNIAIQCQIAEQIAREKESLDVLVEPKVP